MTRTAGISAALRRGTVVACGALGVHQLSYAAGLRADGSRALGNQGHAYLEALLPVLVALAALTVLATALAGLAGVRGAEVRGTPLGRVLVYAIAILAVFVVQELAEGMLVSGHATGIGALVAHGGLVAIPLALAFGSLAWLAVRGLEALEAGLAVVRSREPGGAARSGRRPGWASSFPPARALAAGAAPRAPPAA